MLCLEGNFRQIDQRLGPLQVDFFASRLTYKMETRFDCDDHECLHFELGPVEPDRQGSNTNTPSTSCAYPGGTSMESTELVPCATGNVGGDPTPHFPGEGSDLSHTPV